MTIKLTKSFVRDCLGAAPEGQRRAEFCRDVATGYRAIAKGNGALAAEQRDKANQYMELARRLDANAAQRSPDPIHQHQLWDER